MTIPVYTFDGTAGSGKGTIGLRVAEQLGWHFLDSGALYRLLAHAAGGAGVELEDMEGLAHLARALDVEFGPDGVRLGGVDVDAAVRTETCGNNASRVAAIPAVREALLARQRDFRRPPGLVADGRDMGTVVFPDAALKFFLTASLAERAQRRYKQLKQKGIDVNVGTLLKELTERDERDRARDASPLIPAEGAIVIDTSDMDVDAVFARVMHTINQLVPALPTGRQEN